jgi:hypothetical protein
LDVISLANVTADLASKDQTSKKNAFAIMSIAGRQWIFMVDGEDVQPWIDAVRDSFKEKLTAAEVCLFKYQKIDVELMVRCGVV